MARRLSTAEIVKQLASIGLSPWVLVRLDSISKTDLALIRRFVEAVGVPAATSFFRWPEVSAVKKLVKQQRIMKGSDSFLNRTPQLAYLRIFYHPLVKLLRDPVLQRQGYSTLFE